MENCPRSKLINTTSRRQDLTTNYGRLWIFWMAVNVAIGPEASNEILFVAD